MKQEKEAWFSDWFGTRYYNLLYAHRDQDEAQTFIEHLQGFLNLPPGAKVLDLACGGGRHSAMLSRLGFQVSGIDLSADFIAKAKSLHLPHSEFRVQDMREPFGEGIYHAVFNLFTSFGYFDQKADNEVVLHNIHQALIASGYFVLDFLNPEWVRNTLVSEETKMNEGVEFHIQRCIDPEWIRKKIEVRDSGCVLNFEEKVQAFSLPELKDMVTKAGFRILAVWGDYSGSDWKEDSSSRSILICQKS